MSYGVHDVYTHIYMCVYICISSWNIQEVIIITEIVSTGPSIDLFNRPTSQRPVVSSPSNRFGSHCNKVLNSRATGNESKIYEGGESTGSPPVNNLIKALNALLIAHREKERERIIDRRVSFRSFCATQ